jgi:hypothetical protein
MLFPALLYVILKFKGYKIIKVYKNIKSLSEILSKRLL